MYGFGFISGTQDEARYSETRQNNVLHRPNKTGRVSPHLRAVVMSNSPQYVLQYERSSTVVTLIQYNITWSLSLCFYIVVAAGYIQMFVAT